MKALFAPSIPWKPAQAGFTPGSGPDPVKLYKLLEGHGVASRIVDPYPRPWNPLAGGDTLLQSIDPVRALRIGLRDRDVDVVVSVFEGAAASLAAIKPWIGFDAALTMWDIGLADWRLRERIINYTLPRLDRLYVLGANQIGHIEGKFAPCRGGISAIGHYVDTDFFTPDGTGQDGAILSVGDDVGRDFPTLLAAVEPIDRPVIIKASRRVADTTQADVRIIRERISYPDLRDLYRRSGIVIVPTHVTHNACGVSTILEASACGRPLIVSDNPGIRDFVVPGETCLVVPPNDPAALEAAIRTLAADSALRRRLGANARALAEQKFTYEAFAERLARELHAL